MDRLPSWRWILALIAALLVAVRPAGAFLRFNDGTDQIYVTGMLAMGYDSNIFASRQGSGDVTTTGTLTVEYQRHAGYIGVNATLGWNIGRFDKNTGEDFANPNVSLELTKETGRTHGSLQLTAARQSSADAAANERTTSMSFGANLNWKYPVNERHTLSGDLSWAQTSYINSPGLFNLTSYTANVDDFYTYSSERDFFGGYRVRLSNDGAGTQSIDQDVHLGVSGQIIPKITGSVSVGWQVRQSTGPAPTDIGTYDALTATATATWAYNAKLKINGQLSKDFTTTSTNITTDSLTANLEADYAHNARWSYFVSVGYGLNQFLGAAGDGRTDYDLTWGAGVNYTYNDHFKLSLAYTGFENWSTDSAADYIRNTINLTLTSRW